MQWMPWVIRILFSHITLVERGWKNISCPNAFMSLILLHLQPWHFFFNHLNIWYTFRHSDVSGRTSPCLPSPMECKLPEDMYFAHFVFFFHFLFYLKLIHNIYTHLCDICGWYFDKCVWIVISKSCYSGYPSPWTCIISLYRKHFKSSLLVISKYTIYYC